MAEEKLKWGGGSVKGWNNTDFPPPYDTMTDTCTEDPRHGLLEAIRLGDVDAVKTYVADGRDLHFYAHEHYKGTDPAIVEVVPQWDNVPFVFSVRGQIEDDRDTSYSRAYSEFTPLSYACAMNQTEIAKILVEHGADVNTHLEKITWGNENEELCSPYFPALWWAGVHHNTELALYLWRHGANAVMYYQYDRYTDGVEFFCDAGHLDMIKHFLALDKKPYQNPYCDSDFLLFSACFRYDLPMIRLLLRNEKEPTEVHEVGPRVYTCVTMLEMEYLSRNYRGGELDYWNLAEDVDWKESLDYDTEGVDALAFVVDAGGSMDDIRCPVLREWVTEMRARGRCFGCRRCCEDD